MTVEEYMLSQGRTPSFNSRGQIRGFRSRPGAPPAEVKSGLESGSNAMGASSWVNTFRNTGPAVQRQALTERVQIPGMTGTQMFSGISQPIIDHFMSQSRSANAAATFTNPLSAPFADPLRAFGMPAPTATATPAPSLAQRPYGSSEPSFDWTGIIGQGTKSFSRTGAPQIKSSRYGYAANVAPSFAWNRAFMNG